MRTSRFLSLLFLLVSICVSAQAQIVSTQQQSILTAEAGPASPKINRNRGQKILKKVKENIEKNYYDKTFRGIDLDATYEAASKQIENFDANWQIFRVIAQFVMQFEDSHTRFFPPNRSVSVEYGFSLQMIGNTCFVVDVTKGSDAEKKGLKVGDIVAGIDRYNPNRENLWKIRYILYSLDPLQKINVFVLNEDKTERKLEIEAVIKSMEERRKEAKKRRKEFEPYKCHEVNQELIACRLESFLVDKSDINKMMKEIGDHKKLVLDLRGNSGGYVEIEEYLTGHFFDKDVKIGDFVTRKETTERIAKTRGDKVFKGELVVLIDSETGSAAEVFSRVIQIEKRGNVIGDTSAGAVMTGISVGSTIQRGSGDLMTLTVFGMSVTVADLIMSDGNRLEKVGVTPDIAIGPSGAALFSRADPILSYAVNEFGGNLTSEEAGKLHFLIPKEEGEGTDEEEVQ
ncbi:MAG TPA: S41 family peptidase [Aridibacter sp.]|nr:S41 family peptidase [Aridibacter sp.]